MFVFFSTIFFGTEMLSNLFTLMAFYLATTVLENKRRQHVLLALLWIASYLSWGINSYILLLVFPIVFLLRDERPAVRGALLLASFCASSLLVILLHSQPVLTLTVVLFVIVLARFLPKLTSSPGVFVLRNFAIVAIALLLLTYYNVRTVPIQATLSAMPSEATTVLAGLRLSEFPKLLSDFVGVMGERVGYWLIVGGCLGFLLLSPRKSLQVLPYPLLYTLVFTLYVPSGLGIEFRFVSYTIPFFAVALAGSVASALRFIATRLHGGLVGRRLNQRHLLKVAIVLTVLLVGSFMAANYVPQYPGYVEEMQAIDPIGMGNMRPAFQWIDENCPSDALLAAFKPHFYAWYTARPAVFLPHEVASASDFALFLQNVQVDYLVVDLWIYLYVPVLQSLYLNHSAAPVYLVPMFEDSDPMTGNRVVIYWFNSSALSEFAARPGQEVHALAGCTRHLGMKSQGIREEEPLPRGFQTCLGGFLTNRLRPIS
jgi:hypothetical protein